MRSNDGRQYLKKQWIISVVTFSRFYKNWKKIYPHKYFYRHNFLTKSKNWRWLVTFALAGCPCLSPSLFLSPVACHSSPFALPVAQLFSPLNSVERHQQRCHNFLTVTFFNWIITRDGGLVLVKKIQRASFSSDYHRSLGPFAATSLRTSFADVRV